MLCVLCFRTASAGWEAGLLGPRLPGGTQVSGGRGLTSKQDVILHLLHRGSPCLCVQLTLSARSKLKLGDSCCGRHRGSGRPGHLEVCGDTWNYLAHLGVAGAPAVSGTYLWILKACGGTWEHLGHLGACGGTWGSEASLFLLEMLQYLNNSYTPD